MNKKFCETLIQALPALRAVHLRAMWVRVKTFWFVTGPGRPLREKVCNRSGFFLRQGWRDKAYPVAWPGDKCLKQSRRDKGFILYAGTQGSRRPSELLQRFVCTAGWLTLVENSARRQPAAAGHFAED